ncbi:MAG: branched-chain amino acid ABC transporter permease [Alphaproteobacteria bacterium]
MRSAGAIALLLAALLPLPWLVHSDFWLNLAIMALYYGFLGQAWNLLGGYGGQFSFGHAAFFGTGAYASAVLQVRLGLDPWLCLLLAGLLGGLAGAGIGALCFRYGLRGSYFALVTLAFAEVFRILANSLEFTGAGVGMLIPLKQSAANFQFTGKAGFYLVVLALNGVGLLAAWWIENSRFGARLIAVRENEDAARALGVAAFRSKLAAITLSAALTAMGGTFYAQYFLYIDPAIAYGPGVSVEALLVPIIGGLGTLFGPLLGAVALQLVSQLAQAAMGSAPGLNLMLYGVILVLMIIFMPNGLFGAARVSARRLVGRTA